MDRKPFDRCMEIAARNRSPLFQVSRMFPSGKGRLFLAAYATMRLVDDVVDEQFLVGGNRSENLVKAVLAQVEQWRRQACDAAVGGFYPEKGSYEPLVFTALNQTAGKSNLGDWPWNALADSMKMDIAEHQLETWEDFLTYSEGATVAPATVFVYILASRFQKGSYHTPEPISFYREKVRDMAIFCYVVHILRDLARDVARSKQLVTIPNEIMALAGLDKELLGRWINQEPQKIRPLQLLLLDKARECRVRGMDRLTNDVPLPTLEKRILKKLIVHYTDMFDDMELNLS